LAVADSICQTRATAAGLSNPGNFKAWLSDGSTDAISRMISNGPWVRTDGLKIADSKTDLTDGSIFTAIDKTEAGDTLMTTVWTGSLADGTKAVGTCSNWLDNTVAFNGQIGLSHTAASEWWTSFYSQACNGELRALYCFED
jgi:hypothetical protein